MLSSDRLRAAYATARDALLAERVPAGHWVGELSTSALSTATAVMALHLVNPFEHRALIDGGTRWLAAHQNDDGGWGDTVKSFPNISTTMLCRAALALTGAEKEYPAAVGKVEGYINAHAGRTPERRADAIRRRYGKDRTFSVPILMTCALAKLVPWHEVPRLPFELACLPQSWYRFARLPVVSYALPALIAIGQCVHHHRRSLNPFRNVMRRLARGRSLKVLRRIQPTAGGYLEATPLTSFVVMALASIRRRRSAAERQVMDEGVRFLASSVRPDGSWPIDTNLATWVTTLSVNALAAAGDLELLDTKDAILDWLLKQQYTERHPYTGADPGGWAWTDLPGGVPDCDDTPGAVLAKPWLVKPVEHPVHDSPGVVAARAAFGTLGLTLPLPLNPADWGHEQLAAVNWLLGLQNRDGGWPTFCHGWGKLPFDRSGSDLTAHVLRAFRSAMPHIEACSGRDMTFSFGRGWSSPPRLRRVERATVAGLSYLSREQRPDGSWLPLWFGNHHAPDDSNPVYGTARVLAAYRDLRLTDRPECQRGVSYLLSVQNPDGGWGGGKDCPSSVEETALAVEALLDLDAACGVADEPALSRKRLAVGRGVAWLVDAVESGRFRDPSPIGFYFAKLWYFEKLYPLIFTVAALGRAVRIGADTSAARS